MSGDAGPADPGDDAPLAAVRRVFAGRRVWLTGHSGFKGGWMARWLARLGAEVHGLALPPDQGPDNLYETARVAQTLAGGGWTDLRDLDGVCAAAAVARPEIVLHLAAQPLVRRGWREPVETFAVNVMGTAHVLEAARRSGGVRAMVCVTTDKVYDNVEWAWPYRESDALGGKDPYSASKAAAEMAARAWRAMPDMADCALATARGGNVVGGGDWSQDRLTVDVVRAARDGQTLVLRNPEATRPWQHVLELCFGYLVLAARLWEGRPGVDRMAFADAYNFGPAPDGARTVAALSRALFEAWGAPADDVRIERATLKESTFLRLDPSRAEMELGWRPALPFEQTVSLTAEWYRAYCVDGADAATLVDAQIAAYEQRLAATTPKSKEPADP